MKKKCAVMQPTYLPWLGYFDLIKESDIFIILDHVQFSKQSWQQRNKLRNKNGEFILTVPVKNTSLNNKIRDIKIDHSRQTLKKHFKTIQNNYSKSKNYKKLISEIERIYAGEYSNLQELNIAFIKFGCKHLNINNNIIYSSSLEVKGEKVDALIDICKKTNSNQYLSPLGSKVYIEENNIFEKNNIELIYQNYQHPTYSQLNYKDFISHLSFLDFLFNH